MPEGFYRAQGPRRSCYFLSMQILYLCTNWNWNSPVLATFQWLSSTRSSLLFLKKLVLTKNLVSNYRPISYLSFLSKLTERIILVRLNDYLSSNSLLDLKQSIRLHQTPLQRSSACLFIQETGLWCCQPSASFLLIFPCLFWPGSVGDAYD